eukprot:gnl/MRDRNA2_/MRDRNA2_322088_c0_seq1.p1 gnl/MRDRNA2_/MRDRNA2_322088_c0~~gnl/MRDRNA2_/MRDRNA2_322088_c0_seq1.p1  ORF type:complete len:162 (-),score=33.03 gnl/MRDRNA2_/MRDRNA2_322088_c0_seq1:20-505(-)
MSSFAEQIEEWADEIWEEKGKDPSWSIMQVKCPEEGCPPVETVFTDLSVKRACPGNGVYKVFKPFSEVTKEDVRRALEDPNSAFGYSQGHGTGEGHGQGHEGLGHNPECNDPNCNAGGQSTGKEGNGQGREGQGDAGGYGDGEGHGQGHGPSNGHNSYQPY